jgi:hypothetical protein
MPKKKKGPSKAPPSQATPSTSSSVVESAPEDQSNSSALEALAAKGPIVEEPSALLDEPSDAPADAPAPASTPPPEAPSKGKKKKKGKGTVVEPAPSGDSSADDMMAELLAEEDKASKKKKGKADKQAAKAKSREEESSKQRAEAVAAAQAPVKALRARVTTQSGKCGPIAALKTDEAFLGSYLPEQTTILAREREAVAGYARELERIGMALDEMVRALAGNPRAPAVITAHDARVTEIGKAIDVSAPKVTAAKAAITLPAAATQMALFEAAEVKLLLDPTDAAKIVKQAKTDKLTGPALAKALSDARIAQRTKTAHEWATNVLGMRSQKNLWIDTAAPVVGVDTHVSLFKSSSAAEISMDDPTSSVETQLYGSGATALHTTTELFGASAAAGENPHSYFGGLFIENKAATYDEEVAVEDIEKEMAASLATEVASNRTEIDKFKKTTGK